MKRNHSEQSNNVIYFEESQDNIPDDIDSLRKIQTKLNPLSLTIYNQSTTYNQMCSVHPKYSKNDIISINKLFDIFTGDIMTILYKFLTSVDLMSLKFVSHKLNSIVNSIVGSNLTNYSLWTVIVATKNITMLKWLTDQNILEWNFNYCQKIINSGNSRLLKCIPENMYHIIHSVTKLSDEIIKLEDYDFISYLFDLDYLNVKNVYRCFLQKEDPIPGLLWAINRKITLTLNGNLSNTLHKLICSKHNYIDIIKTIQKNIRIIFKTNNDIIWFISNGECFVKEALKRRDHKFIKWLYKRNFSFPISFLNHVAQYNDITISQWCINKGFYFDAFTFENAVFPNNKILDVNYLSWLKNNNCPIINPIQICHEYESTTGMLWAVNNGYSS